MWDGRATLAVEGGLVAWPKIRHVRAFTVRGGGADYHDQAGAHWIDDHIATPMSRYPEYRESRRSFGINVLGTLVVEIEADDGTIGFAVTTGGEARRFHRGKAPRAFSGGTRPARNREDLGPDVLLDPVLRPQRFGGERHIRRRPSALGPSRADCGTSPSTPCWAGAVRDELTFYATGARPDAAKALGFVGGKMPLHHGPAEGDEGVKEEPSRGRR